MAPNKYQKYTSIIKSPKGSFMAHEETQDFDH